MIKEFLFTLVVTGTLFPGFPALSQPGVTIEHHVAMKTRDGVSLYADIYRPAGEGSFPVLLQRTPYNRQNAADFGHMAAARGFMVVVQDVRGRYESEGEWYPFKHEIDDGYDTVEWAAGLPHANGKVGMFGGSYVGATQMLAAVGHPPHLAGICPVVTASNYHENWTYQGERSSSGSMSRGLRGWRRTLSTAPCAPGRMPWSAARCSRSSNIRFSTCN